MHAYMYIHTCISRSVPETHLKQVPMRRRGICICVRRYR
jgi:hypothetical protein